MKLSSEGNENLEYVCTADDCWYKGRVQKVERGKEATCTKCGSMMSARYGD